MKTAYQLYRNELETINQLFELGMISHVEKISKENIKTVIIQGEKDNFGSPDMLNKEFSNFHNIEIINAGNLTHKLSNGMGDLVINSIRKNGLIDRHGSV